MADRHGRSWARRFTVVVTHGPMDHPLAPRPEQRFRQCHRRSAYTGPIRLIAARFRGRPPCSCSYAPLGARPQQGDSRSAGRRGGGCGGRGATWLSRRWVRARTPAFGMSTASVSLASNCEDDLRRCLALCEAPSGFRFYQPDQCADRGLVAGKGLGLQATTACRIAITPFGGRAPGPRPEGSPVRVPTRRPHTSRTSRRDGVQPNQGQPFNWLSPAGSSVQLTRLPYRTRSKDTRRSGGRGRRSAVEPSSPRGQTLPPVGTADSMRAIMIKPECGASSRGARHLNPSGRRSLGSTAAWAQLRESAN